MTVCDLCELYIEGREEMEIWSSEEEKTVFRGSFDEAAYSEYADAEVGSFGIEDGKIVINIIE